MTDVDPAAPGRGISYRSVEYDEYGRREVAVPADVRAILETLSEPDYPAGTGTLYSRTPTTSREPVAVGVREDGQVLLVKDYHDVAPGQQIDNGPLSDAERAVAAREVTAGQARWAVDSALIRHGLEHDAPGEAIGLDRGGDHNHVWGPTEKAALEMWVRAQSALAQKDVEVRALDVTSDGFDSARLVDIHGDGVDYRVETLTGGGVSVSTPDGVTRRATTSELTALVENALPDRTTPVLVGSDPRPGPAGPRREPPAVPETHERPPDAPMAGQTRQMSLSGLEETSRLAEELEQAAGTETRVLIGKDSVTVLTEDEPTTSPLAPESGWEQALTREQISDALAVAGSLPQRPAQLEVTARTITVPVGEETLHVTRVGDRAGDVSFYVARPDGVEDVYTSRDQVIPAVGGRAQQADSDRPVEHVPAQPGREAYTPESGEAQRSASPPPPAVGQRRVMAGAGPQVGQYTSPAPRDSRGPDMQV
ncbi:hypothetical protein [Actinomyces israelii]|uniref:hypothetical protein n=1 Tax=Actinomyces israelii TaxID=1659 RepID=UPI0005BB8D46|nr:hypothetical protein [Actinomyces israelii]